MRDTNRVFFWPREPFPAGAALWPKMVGFLTGYGESHHQNTPDYFCPHLVTRGRGTVCTRHGRWPVAAGSLFTLWPGETIDYFEDPAAPWEFYWIHLHGEGTPAYMRACGFTPRTPCFPARDPVLASRLFRLVHEAFQRQQSGDEFRVLGGLYELVAGCNPPPAATAGGGGTDPRAELVSHATATLETLLHTSLNINEMAAMFQVSRVTLFRAFRVRLGMGPMDYLTQARIRRARELLRQGGMSVGAVARAAGFRNEKYFRRCFRQATGQTPSAYRPGPAALAVVKGAGTGV